jgi:hypothetical protein
MSARQSDRAETLTKPYEIGSRLAAQGGQGCPRSSVLAAEVSFCLIEILLGLTPVDGNCVGNGR